MINGAVFKAVIGFRLRGNYEMIYRRVYRNFRRNRWRSEGHRNKTTIYSCLVSFGADWTIWVPCVECNNVYWQVQRQVLGSISIIHVLWSSVTILSEIEVCSFRGVTTPHFFGFEEGWRTADASCVLFLLRGVYNIVQIRTHSCCASVLEFIHSPSTL